MKQLYIGDLIVEKAYLGDTEYVADNNSKLPESIYDVYSENFDKRIGSLSDIRYVGDDASTNWDNIDPYPTATQWNISGDINYVSSSLPHYYDFFGTTTNDRMSKLNSSGLATSGSFVCWINPDTYHNGAIFNIRNSSDTDITMLALKDDGKIFVRTPNSSYTSSLEYTTGSWQQIAFTFTDNDLSTWTLYHNYDVDTNASGSTYPIALQFSELGVAKTPYQDVAGNFDGKMSLVLTKRQIFTHLQVKQLHDFYAGYLFSEY